jgi:hypothetical protein
MSADNRPVVPAPLDLSRWRKVPNALIGVGGVLALLGAILNLKQFGYSWLLAFMFCLSLCLGGFFLVLVHHLFDASWSVPIRRFCEHLATLLYKRMLWFFIPIVLLAPKIYEWIDMLNKGQTDHALHTKHPLFTVPGFYIVAVVCFAVWWLIPSRLRYWSLKQDETGAAECTRAMRSWSSVGIFAFAVTLTLGAIMWMKALQHQWFSTMYGVYYFAGSVWTTLATVYLITVVLQRQGYLKDVVHQETYYFIGSLLFAFTVFYAYIHFSQYFIIWNANMPEETFWYKLRENGSWLYIGIVIIIFCHFFVPFLLLLRIDWKLYLPLMGFLGAWAWLNHFFDLSFNIMPVLHPDGFPARWLWLDLGCLAFMVGWLAKAFLKEFNAHPPYPVKDPRLAEGLGVYVPPAPVGSTAASHGGAK